MLTTLRLRHLALVEELALEFSPGLVVVTGETGAGKSVILGALNLLLGARADRTWIRAGADSCTVEAVFDVRRLPAGFGTALAEQGVEPCEDHHLLLKRTFTAAGTNRQFINGSPVTLATLATVGDRLVDMHGPHEHQSLLHPARQLTILDAFGGLDAQVRALTALVRRRQALEQEKAALIVDEATYARQLDLLRHQVAEITAAQLRPDEEESLAREHQRASNAARLLQLGQAALHLLSEDEASVLNQAGALGRLLQELHRLDPENAPLGELQAQALATWQELHRELHRYLERIEVDPARLAALEERWNLLQNLRRKYGPSLEAVQAFGQDARRRLEQLESRDETCQRLNAELERLDRELHEAAAQLSRARQQVAPRLCREVSRHLSDLGFGRCRFEVALSPVPIGLRGGEAVEFVFAPNPGEPARPLRAIASSGEMARVMLAIKTVLAAEDEIPVLVFDEVDANVGGETARAVGEKMRQIARRRQVFCVTHLAPVAAAGDAHFRVTKEVRDGRTFTHMERLEERERILELARMLGGPTEAARRHARVLLEAAAGAGT